MLENQSRKRMLIQQNYHEKSGKEKRMNFGKLEQKVNKNVGKQSKWLVKLIIVKIFKIIILETSIAIITVVDLKLVNGSL